MNTDTCSFDGCDNTRSSLGLCRGHYMQKRRGKDLAPLRKPTAKVFCSFDGCEADEHVRGLCVGHYGQLSRGKTLTPIVRYLDRTCIFDGCDGKIRSKGLCGGHYTQHVKGLELKPLSTRAGVARVVAMTCAFDGCGKTVTAKGLCPGHYHQHLEGRELTPLRRKQSTAAPCTVDDCGRKSISTSGGEPMCSTHHQRWIKYGDARRTSGRTKVTERGTAAIVDAVSAWDRSECWTRWADLECWADTDGWGGKHENGYPKLGAAMVMHLSMEADGRPRPPAPGNQGLHSCHNRGCWNPDHLRWGTASDNAMDNVDRLDYCKHCAHCNPEA